MKRKYNPGMKMGTHEHIVKLVVCASDPLENSCCIRKSTIKSA